MHVSRIVMILALMLVLHQRKVDDSHVSVMQVSLRGFVITGL